MASEDIQSEYSLYRDVEDTVVIGNRTAIVKMVTTIELKHKNVYHVHTPVPSVHLKLYVSIITDLPYTITTVKETILNYTFPV